MKRYSIAGLIAVILVGALIWGCQCVPGERPSAKADPTRAPVVIPGPTQSVDRVAQPVVTNAVTAASAEPCSYYGRIAERLGEWLPKYHVLQQKLDDTISRRAWTNLVTTYDYDHAIFLKTDLDRLAAHETTIDDEIAKGDVGFGTEVFELYATRLRERIGFATNLLLTADWDFSTNETYRVKRRDAPWPETTAEAEDCWRRRIKNEVLALRIAAELDKSTNAAEIVTNLVKKYRQSVQVLNELDGEAVLQHYLSALARAYDPHSDYMTPELKEDFDVEMNLKLCGVGAVLSMDEGALKIVEIMPGGPVDRDGRIEEGDKIVGVQQENGPMEDVMWKPMMKTIQKIRGKKDTRVTLEIVPHDDASGTMKKRIELVRDEIKLEDQAATGRVERVVLNGVTNRLGYVFLPSFYGTMDKRTSDPDFRSSALDIAKIVAQFNAQGVQGMVLDLRGNGGGSLREAVLLSALFVPEGPVVQIRDVRSIGALPIPSGNPAAFRKPLVVLTDRASASASEIVAGHLQDVGRAVIVGDRKTHGKGTVQTVIGMGPLQYGSCKITTARFYRVNGRSTQVEGVAADIRLPSILDSLDIGEDKLPNALPFSRVLPADLPWTWNLGRYVPELKARSDARLRDDTRYQTHLKCVEGTKEISERTEVPLEYAARKRMIEADRALREEDDEDEDGKSSRRRRNEKPKNDVVLDEALRILADLVELVGTEEMPRPKLWWEE